MMVTLAFGMGAPSAHRQPSNHLHPRQAHDFVDMACSAPGFLRAQRLSLHQACRHVCPATPTHSKHNQIVKKSGVALCGAHGGGCSASAGRSVRAPAAPRPRPAKWKIEQQGLAGLRPSAGRALRAHRTSLSSLGPRVAQARDRRSRCSGGSLASCHSGAVVASCHSGAVAVLPAMMWPSVRGVSKCAPHDS